jgi:hypothetical protein
MPHRAIATLRIATRNFAQGHPVMLGAQGFVERASHPPRYSLAVLACFAISRHPGGACALTEVAPLGMPTTCPAGVASSSLSWNGAGTDFFQHQERATLRYPGGVIQFSSPPLFLVTPPSWSGTSHTGLSVSMPRTGREDLL